MRLLVTMMGAILTIVIAFGVAQAAGRSPDARCWTQPGAADVGQTVEIWADGLPTKTALNLFVTDPHGTYGWPVGVQPSGRSRPCGTSPTKPASRRSVSRDRSARTT